MLNHLKQLKSRLAELRPDVVRAKRQNLAARHVGLQHLAALSRNVEGRISPYRKVLIDGQWDNANFWFRLALFRRALGLADAQEVGVTGAWAGPIVTDSFRVIGINDVVSLNELTEAFRRKGQHWRDRARSMRSADDIPSLELPHGFPSIILYDALLKTQRRSTVDVGVREFPDQLADAVAMIEAREAFIEQHQPDVVLLSHPFNVSYGGLAWAALRRGIPIFVLQGNYGVNRFLHLTKPSDIFQFPGAPTLDDAARLSPKHAEQIRVAGRQFILHRLTGQSQDISGVYAHAGHQVSIDRKRMIEVLGLNPAKPIIGVYVPTMIDFPHQCGDIPSRDFATLTEMIATTAIANDQFNWVFRLHPVEDWYGSVKGPRIKEFILTANARNCRLAQDGWKGIDFINAIDAAITVNGTIGIEAAIVGKPVLVPYRGWYGSHGFVTVASSQADFIRLLGARWWDQVDRPRARAAAELFAGFYYCAPDWHRSYTLLDDGYQDSIWWDFESFLAQNADVIEREIEEIASWAATAHPFLQSYKIARAEDAMTPAARVIEGSTRDPRRRQLQRRADVTKDATLAPHRAPQ